VRLHVDVLGAPELFCAIDSDPFEFVDVFAPAVIATTGIALGVLIREDASLRVEDCLTRVILARNECERLALSVRFVLQYRCYVWIDTPHRIILHPVG
jgi:hypothetical protein